jgi:hypothetical protein
MTNPFVLARRTALRRLGLGLGGALGVGLAAVPEVGVLAAQVGDFVLGPPVADVAPHGGQAPRD